MPVGYLRNEAVSPTPTRSLALTARGDPRRNGLQSGCHGHGFAWPCLGRREVTATQSRDRGTQGNTSEHVAACSVLEQPLTATGSSTRVVAATARCRATVLSDAEPPRRSRPRTAAHTAVPVAVARKLSGEVVLGGNGVPPRRRFRGEASERHGPLKNRLRCRSRRCFPVHPRFWGAVIYSFM